MERHNRTDPGSHVGRVFSLLDLLGQQSAPATLSEIARQAGLPVSTTHRLLGELVSWGGVERTDSGLYRLGDKIWRLGVTSSWERDLRRVALPHARELAACTGAAVAISTMVGDQLICLDTIRGRLRSVYLAQPGDEIPLFATSAGKLLMSTVDRQALTDALRTRLERRTQYTQIVPKLVLAQLEAARQAGFAVSHSESTMGQSSLSVPVSTGIDHTPMALTLLVPTTQADLPKLTPVLRKYAEVISRSIVNRA
ncbi:IclR family transcriptional regulator [Streptomyces sp. NPDC091219]|uniref:IclR family transcriptional regulator n=1 Tax=Streptomyces sp. NPDC091219 TaxID=3155193 RepID=UPI00344EB7F2